MVLNPYPEHQKLEALKSKPQTLRPKSKTHDLEQLLYFQDNRFLLTQASVINLLGPRGNRL